MLGLALGKTACDARGLLIVVLCLADGGGAVRVLEGNSIQLLQQAANLRVGGPLMKHARQRGLLGASRCRSRRRHHDHLVPAQQARDAGQRLHLLQLGDQLIKLLRGDGRSTVGTVGITPLRSSYVITTAIFKCQPSQQ